jgi:hypothetical protein
VHEHAHDAGPGSFFHKITTKHQYNQEVSVNAA